MNSLIQKIYYDENRKYNEERKLSLSSISDDSIKEFCNVKKKLIFIFDNKCIKEFQKNKLSDECSTIRHLLFDTI